jgi:hypothetical protein
LAELCVAANAVSEDMIGLNILHERRGTAADRKQRLPDSRNVFEGADRGARAGGRHADATGTFIVSTPFLKAGEAKLASRLWDLPAGAVGFALLPRLFAG